jgi:hypothetical protein
MKNLIKILIALLVAVCAGSFSVTTLAAGKGGVVYLPAEAVIVTVSKIDSAVKTIVNNESANDIESAISEASSASKFIYAKSSKGDKARRLASKTLVEAKNAVHQGDIKQGKTLLEDARQQFLDLNALF